MERHQQKLEDLREFRSMIEEEIRNLSALVHLPAHVADAHLSGGPERWEGRLALMREGKGALDRKIVELERKVKS